MKKIELTTALITAIDKAIGNEYSEIEIEEKLTELLGAEVSWYDGAIDDGCDDEDDEYVMKACFEVIGTGITIRVYYGNNTLEIGYVDIREN